MGWALATQMALLALGGLAGPQQSFTSPVFNDAGVSVLACMAHNVATTAVLVTAELRDANGAVIDGGEALVPPGQRVELAGALDAVSGYCAFTFDAELETLRGYVHVRSPAGDTIALFPHFGVRPGGGSTMTETMTPPLRRVFEATLGCIVQNLDDEEVTVDVELVDADGTVADSTAIQMLPGRFAAVLNSSAPHVGAYCRFSFTAPPAAVHGYAILYGGAANTRHLVFPATSRGGIDSPTLTAASPPVSSLAGDATACVVLNLDPLAVTVDAELVDASGAVLDDGSDIIPPGHVEAVAGHTEAGTDTVCRFTFTNLGDKVHAFITRFPSGLASNTDLLARAAVVYDLPARPTTTHSPPLGVGGDGSLYCTAVNSSGADEMVHVAIEDGSGTAVAMADLAVPAGGAASGPAVQNQTQAFCTFTFDANPEAVRGFATLTDDTLRTRLVFAAIEPGGPPPTASPTVTATSTRVPSSTPSATRTATPTRSASATPTRTASATPTSTADATPTSTATAPATPTVAPSDTPGAPPTHTPTAPPDRTPTATAPPAACAGDCDGDGVVSIAELVTLVAIALGAPADCDAGDRNGDGAITIEELVVAVANALQGCA